MGWIIAGSVVLGILIGAGVMALVMYVQFTKNVHW